MRDMTTQRIENLLVSCGMIGAICFFAYVIVGASFVPMSGIASVGIAALVTKGSPEASWLRVFAFAYAIFTFAFSAGMLMRAYRAYNRLLFTAYVVFFNMLVLFIVGFALFPLRGAFVQGGGNSTVHAVISAFVAIGANAFAFLAGFGYHQQAERKQLGLYGMLWAIFITVINISSLILICSKAELMGLGERAVVFALMFLVFTVSYTETFTATRYNRIRREE